MEESEAEFPNKEFRIIQTICEENMVATYSHIKMTPEDIWIIVVHIMRFEEDKIVEMWDVGQKLEKNSPNENGIG